MIKNIHKDISNSFFIPALFMERGSRRQRVRSLCKGWSMGQTYPQEIQTLCVKERTRKDGPKVKLGP